MKPRPLSLLDISCVGVNAIVGSSIFLFPGKLAELLGPASILAFGATALLLLPVGLCFAEAASRFDRAGGPYLYAREAFGPGIGYGIGWMCWVTAVVSWAAVANGIAVYLGHFGPAFASAPVVKGAAAGAVLALAALNYRGVKLGAWASNFFTAAKLLPLLIFTALALPQARPEAFAEFAPHGWKPIGAACFLAYFAFQGFETVPVPAGEVERPERSVPRAVLIAMSVAAVLYMLVQAAAVGVHPGLAGSERPLAEAAQLALGPWGAALIVAGAVLSMIGYNAGCALGCPRYLVALSEQGDMPAALSARHPRYATPFRAVGLTAGVAFVLAMALDFGRLVDITNIVICVQFVSTCLAVPLLRRRGRAPLELPGGWSLPLMGVASTLWLGAQGQASELGAAVLLLGLGFIVRSLWRRWAPAAAGEQAPA